MPGHCRAVRDLDAFHLPRGLSAASHHRTEQHCHNLIAADPAWKAEGTILESELHRHHHQFSSNW